MTLKRSAKKLRNFWRPKYCKKPTELLLFEVLLETRSPQKWICKIVKKNTHYIWNMPMQKQYIHCVIFDREGGNC